MNLGFHYHTPAYVGANGKIFTAGYLGVFLDSLAIEFDTLTCFLHEPLTSEMNKMDYEIKAINVKLVSIGPHYNLVKRLLVNPGKIKESQESFYSIDVMLLRVPTPFIHPIYRNALKFEVPVVLLIVGDYIQSAKELKAGLAKKWLIQAFSYFNAKQQRKIARKALVFVNSRVLVFLLLLLVILLYRSKLFLYEYNSCDLYHGGIFNDGSKSMGNFITYGNQRLVFIRIMYSCSEK